MDLEITILSEVRERQIYDTTYMQASLVAQAVKNSPAMQDTWV